LAITGNACSIRTDILSKDDIRVVAASIFDFPEKITACHPALPVEIACFAFMPIIGNPDIFDQHPKSSRQLPELLENPGKLSGIFHSVD